MRSLKTFYFVFIFVGVSIVVGIVSAFVFKEINDYTQENIIERNTLLLNSLEMQVDSFLEEHKRWLRHLCLRKKIDKEELRDVLKEVDSIESIVILDKDGIVKNYISKKETKEDFTGFDFSKKEYFQKAKEQEVFVSKSFLSSFTNNPTVSLSIKDGARIIVININLSYLSKVVEKLKNYHNFKIARIIDNKHVIIANPAHPEFVSSRVVFDRIDLNRAKNISSIHIAKDLMGKKIVISAKKIKDINWFVLVVEHYNEAFRYQIKFQNYLVIFIIAFLLIAFVVSHYITNIMLLPLKEFSKKIKQVTKAKYEKDFKLFHFKELENLFNKFAIMQEAIKDRENKLKEMNEHLQQIVDEQISQIRKKDELLQQQSKLAAMGEMIGAIAHQWRQPLNALGLIIQDIAEAYEFNELNKEYIQDTVKKSMQQINFMSKTIDDFRNFFRIDKQKELFDVKKAIKETINIMQAQLKHHNINVDVNGEDFKIEGFANEFKQVVLNIINNAKDAIIEKGIKEGKIKIILYKQKVIIADNAGGIPEGIIDRIFEPYFTTKEQGKGTGMGLYMSKMIIENNMQGILSVKNINGGAKFVIDFSNQQKRA